MLVDLLSRQREVPLPVSSLITVGSQAPMLFKFDALGLDTARTRAFGGKRPSYRGSTSSTAAICCRSVRLARSRAPPA